MKATEVLMNEHRVIEQVLSCLDQIAAQAEASGALDTTSAAEALDFFRSFADRCHHGKEEGHLFPLLESRGMPRSGGPTGVLLSEHDLGRALLARMAEATGRGAAAEFVPPARGYVELMRQHIRKEDQRLFPMAGQLLSAADDERLMDSFASTESHDMGEGTHENYLQLANLLAHRFGVERAAAPAACSGGCSHRRAATAQSCDG